MAAHECKNILYAYYTRYSIAQKLSNKQSAKVIFVGLINLEQQEQQESKEAYEH